MLRILIVLNHDVRVDLDDFRREFSGIHLVIAHETGEFLSIICKQNPHVVVSIGNVKSTSVLWRLPMWRRLRWLNLPDGRHSATEIRQAALSLLAATCDSQTVASDAVISAVCMSLDPEDIALGYKQLFESQNYENLEFLVQESLFDEVTTLLRNSIALGLLVKIPDSHHLGPIGQLKNAVSHAKGEFLWPISKYSSELSRGGIQQAIDAFEESIAEGVVLGSNPTFESMFEELNNGEISSISQFFIRTRGVLEVNQFGRDFPFESLSGLFLNLCMTSRLKCIDLRPGGHSSPRDWWQETDEHRITLLKTNVRLAQHRLQLAN